MADELSQEEIDAMLAGDMGDTDPESGFSDALSALEDQPAAPTADSGKGLDELREKNPTLDRALSIPVEVSAMLSEKVMRVEEVLELYVGSVIQFDKNVDDPLELRLGQVTIAQGDVVTIGDRMFGIRLRNVAPPLKIVGSMNKPFNPPS